MEENLKYSDYIFCYLVIAKQMSYNNGIVENTNILVDFNKNELLIKETNEKIVLADNNEIHYEMLINKIKKYV